MTGFDHSGIGRLAAALGTVRAQVIPNTVKAVTVTARKTKDGWNGRLYREGHASRTGRSVSYDVEKHEAFGSTVIEAEIGPLAYAGRQAGIVRLLENGSVHNPPHGYGTAALHEQEGDFERGIARAIADAEQAGGL